MALAGGREAEGWRDAQMPLSLHTRSRGVLTQPGAGSSPFPLQGAHRICFGEGEREMCVWPRNYLDFVSKEGTWKPLPPSSLTLPRACHPQKDPAQYIQFLVSY